MLCPPKERRKLRLRSALVSWGRADVAKRSLSGMTSALHFGGQEVEEPFLERARRSAIDVLAGDEDGASERIHPGHDGRGVARRQESRGDVEQDVVAVRAWRALG